MSHWIKFSLGEYLRRSHKVAISLPELTRQTNSFSVKNRPGCEPELRSSNPGDLFLKYNVTCHLPTSDPRGHEVDVHFDTSKVEETGKANDIDVRIRCSCPAELYWGSQWNLNQRDALEGEARPLLQAPKDRLDLRSNFVICKHMKAVSERILPAVQHNINNILRQRHVDEYQTTHPEPQTPERLQRDQERMKKRKEIEEKRRHKNKEVEEALLEALRKREEAKQPPPETPGEVDRTEPATPEVREAEKPKNKTLTSEQRQDIKKIIENRRKGLEEDRKKKFKDFVEKRLKGKNERNP